MKRTQLGRPRRGETLTCAREGCEATFYAKPTQIGRRRFCSPECSRLVQKVERRGKGNPNYRHGRRVGERELSKVWNLALKGEDACRWCSSKKDVQLHHAIPRSVGTRESRVNLLNGLPLCAACHQGWHRRWLVITRDVFKPEEWAYLCSVRLTGRETLAWLEDRYPAEMRVARCSRGHRLVPENIAVNGTGKRTCRVCRNAGQRERRAA